MPVCNADTVSHCVSLPFVVTILTEISCLDLMSECYQHPNITLLSLVKISVVVFMNLMLKNQFFFCVSHQTCLTGEHASHDKSKGLKSNRLLQCSALKSLNPLFHSHLRTAMDWFTQSRIFSFFKDLFIHFLVILSRFEESQLLLVNTHMSVIQTSLDGPDLKPMYPQMQSLWGCTFMVLITHLLNLVTYIKV